MATLSTKRSTTLSTQITLPTSKTTATTKTAATLPTQVTLPTNVKRTAAVNTQQSFYADYNDPYELNSVADAVLNNEAIKKASEGWGIFSWVEKVPILRNIGALVDVVYNKEIKPIMEGDWKAAGVNLLMNLGETLDIVANPVKGLLMEGGEGFIKGLGVGSEGRKNYDWDTGNWVADLGLEVITDPLNWISFGGKAAISAGAKAVTKEALSETTEKLVKETAQALAKKAGKEITEEIIQEATEKVTKRLVKASTRTLVDYTTEAIQEAAEKELKKLTKVGIKTTLETEVEKQLLKRTTQLKGIILDELAKDLPDAAKVLLKDTDSVVFKTLSKNIDEMLSSMQWDVLAKRINKTISTLYNASESFEKFLFQSVFMTSGLGLGWKAIKPLMSAGGEFIENTIIRNMRKSKYIDANNVIDIFKYDAAKQLYSESYKMARTINAGDVSRQTDTFYRWVRNQFSVDETILREIAQTNVKNSDVAMSAMEKYIQNRYKGASLADYFAQVKKINADENGFYNKYVQYLNRLQSRITNAPSGKITGANKGLVIGKLYSKEIREAHTKQLEEYLNIINELNKGKEPYDVLQKKIKFSADTVYSQVKFNELYIQSKILGNPEVNKFITNIATGADGTLGAVIKNIISDPNAYASDNMVRELAQHINDIAVNAKTFEEFSNDILTTLYETIEGVNANKFRETILDVFYSFNSLKATDVVTNIDTISAEFIAKIEEALNSQYKTAIAGRTRISVPINTRELLKDQVLKYAQTLADTNADSLLCYPLSKDFTSAIVEFQKRIGNSFDSEEIALALYSITATFKEADTFKEAQTFFQRNIFEVNATLKDKYLGGGTDIVSTLYDGLHGAYQYGVRDAIDMHNMQLLFTFKEGQFYDINLMENASDFTKTFMANFNKLNDDLAAKYLTEDVVKQLDSWLDTLYKEYQVILDKAPYANLEFLNYINFKNLNNKQKFALLQSLNNMKDQIGESFLTSHFARMKFNTNYNLISPLVYNPKKLIQETVVYNPQYLLNSYNTIIYYRDLAKAVADYNGIADTSSQIFKGLKDFNDVLKQTQDNISPLVQLNERHIKIANDMNNNVLRYTENKMKSLWDQNIADELLKEYKEYLSLEDYTLLQKFYSEELLTAEEYTHLIEVTNKAIEQKGLVDHKEIVENYKEVLSKNQKEGFKRVKEETSKHLTVPEFQTALEQGQIKQISTDWNGDVSEATLPSGEKIYLWTRTRTTTEPFDTLPEYDARYMSITDSEYNEDYATYSTKITEAFKDLDYLNYRLEYRKDWTAQQRLVKAYSLIAKNPKMSTQQALADAVGYNKRGFIKNPELLNRMQKVNTDLQSKYSNEINAALDYARSTEWIPQIKTLKNEFLNKYDSEDVRGGLEFILKSSYDRKKIFKELEKRFKDTMSIEEYTQLQRDLNKLFKDIEGAPYTKIQKVVDTMHQDLHRQLGRDLQDLYMQRFKEPSNQIYQDWVKTLPKPVYRNIEEPFAKQKAYHDQLKQATDKHSQAVLTNFLSLSPEEIQKELAFRGRLVMFGKSDFAQDKGMKTVYKQFNYKKADLEKLGVKVVEDQDMVIVYLSKDVDVKIYNGQYYLAGAPITRNYTTLDYNEFGFDAHLQREFKKYNQHLETLTGHSPNTSLGDIMDKDLLETIYNGFDEKTLTQITEEAKQYGEIPQYWKGLPDAVKKDLPELAELSKADYFDQYLFNESILGTAASRKRIQAYTPNNMVKTVKNTMEQVGVHLKAKAEFIDGIMDSIYSISKGSYAQYTDEEILEALVRSPRYRLCYLKEDPKWGVKIVEIPALNVEAIKTARKLNAVILPQAVYAKMYNVINHRLGGSGFFKLWNRIMYLYKFGYLFNPGTIARNWIDTNLKTDMELGETARQFKRQARDYIRQFREISQQVADMNDNLITRKGLEEFFSNSTEFSIDYDTYMMLEDFFKNGPVTDITKQPSLMDMGDGDLWRSFTNVTSKVMNWANQTENVNRLAMYLADLDKGIFKHDAWEHISKVHFDYAFKTRTEELIESVFPFSTFAIRNIEYWVETLEKHPEFMGLFRDIYTPIWNFDSLTPEQLNASQALQYQIINGSINLFDINDTSYIARINPSIFDAISTVSNPVQAVQNKLASPIQDVFAMITGQEEPSVDMLPIIGAIKQRIEKANKEQNILPSLITKRTTKSRTQKAPKASMWQNKNLNNYNGIQNTSNPYYVLPKIRSDSRIDPLRTIGTRAFTSRMMAYPKVKVKVNVYNKVKYDYHQDVYQGIRYQLKLNVNKFR
jgi:hypothetical protein